MKDEDTEADGPVHYDLLLTDASKFTLYISVKDLRPGSILETPCRTFQKNVERVAIMSSVTQLVVDATTRHILMLCQATFDVLKKPVMDDTEVIVHQEAICEKYSELASTEFKSDGFFCGKQRMLHLFQCDALRYHKRERINSPASWDGYYTLLASQLIAAWTALEALIEDVWIAVVNAHPELVTKSYKDRNFTITELQNHGFNWGGRVGELLKDRMDFGKLDKERLAYEKMLPANSRVHAALKSSALEAAHCIRNVLVHDGGRANQGYDKTRAEFHRPWRDVRRGELLPLTGRNVARLTSVIVCTGNRILRDIDCWLPKLEQPSSK